MLFTKKVNPREDLNKLEEKIIKKWKKDKIFERSIQNRKDAPIYSFFDGPPFATGVPHYGTLLSSVAKDIVPRYWTMKGYRVDRRWGWDCHGLPAENLVEKKLHVNSKKEIEELVGVKKFNETCCYTVNQMADEWEWFIDRIGRWVDYKNAYLTMEKTYMESVWWAFKELHNKGLIYEAKRISLYCSRCETPLSNFEIAMDNSYEEIVEASVFVKFKIKDEKYPETFFLVWTTTPWTLPANTALAVGEDVIYLRIKTEKNESFIIAKDRTEELSEKFAVLEEIKGIDLGGISYEPLYSESGCLEGGEEKNVYKVWTASFVSMEDGSGIVHIAPAFGEDDFNLAHEKDIPTIDNLDSKACYKEGRFKGRNVFETNKKIITDLRGRSLLYKEKPITHSYPFCYRCKTKLLYKTQPAWFLNIQKIKEKLIEKNEEINWKPEHLKHGRFLKGLEGAPDWNLSRDRFWATPLPVWRCDKCKKDVLVGSYQELYDLSGQKLEDYHRPYIDEVNFSCECGGTYKRISQVFDCWFESGSMPFAERHYPFENQEDFTKKFPAEYIAEYISQTRGWFYVLHVLAVALFDSPAFKNVITTGVIAGEDGKKMSKSLGNYTDPKEILKKYGADALRFYLMNSPIMEAENLAFSPKDVEEIRKKLITTIWNSYAFFATYAVVDKYDLTKAKKIVNSDQKNLLDRWILSELNVFIKNFGERMDHYEIAKACRLIPKFVDNLSNWYIRRSRRRFWKSENDEDKWEAFHTLYEALVKFTQAIAPVLPFMSETIYTALTQEKSVHLANFPIFEEQAIDENLMKLMQQAREIVKEALALRAKYQIKVRQPLLCLFINQKEFFDNEELIKIISEEVNVKKVEYKEEIKESEDVSIKEFEGILIGLKIKLSENLKKEGVAREIVRHLQAMRKKAGYQVDDHIVVNYKGGESVFGKFHNFIKKETLADILEPGKLEDPDIIKEINIDNQKIILEINQVEKIGLKK